MDRLIYSLVRLALFPFGYLPYFILRAIAKPLGLIAYHCMPTFRKKTVSNVALANLPLKTAKESFQNLVTLGLEYAKLARQKDFNYCKNPPDVPGILFCGHQSNWEVLFLDATSRWKGTAIGRPVKNRFLYNWIVSIRERAGGKIIAPKNAIKEGLRALKQGRFLGIVGDQAMPESNYSCPFFGRRTWVSPIPALLAYRTNSPLIFTNAKRVRHGFEVEYSPPIWPNLAMPMETEVPRMMDAVLAYLEEAVRKEPGEYLWQHNRFKQQTMHNLYRRFRQDCIAVILPKNGAEAIRSTLEEIYPGVVLQIIDSDIVEDYKPKLVLNFTDRPVRKYYPSALEVVSLKDLEKLAEEHRLPHHTMSDILKRALCRPNSIWSNAV